MEKTPLHDTTEETTDTFRLMADTAPVMIWMSCTDGLCNFFNKLWLDFRGRTMEQELGDGWMQGIHPLDFDASTEAFEKSVKVFEAFRLEFRLRRFDGEFRWLLGTGVPRFDKRGQCCGYIGSCIDITDRKNMEVQLRKSREELEEGFEQRTKELSNQKENLEKMNLTLQEVLMKNELEKKQIKEDIIANVEELILPLLKKIKKEGSIELTEYVNLLEKNIRQLTSPFGSQISDRRWRLTPREIEVCDMIKNGLSSKEMAKLLNTSHRTVEIHRQNVRRKLKISNLNINLITYLRTL